MIKTMTLLANDNKR